MNLVTKAEADVYMAAKGNLPDGGVPNDLITDISARMARYCGRTDWGVSESRTEYMSGPTQFLSVNIWPISSVTSIYDDPDHSWDSGTLLDSSTYYYATDDFSGGIIFFEFENTLAGFKNLKVTYTGGYASSSTVPTQIKRACLLQIEYDLGRTIPGRYTNVPGEYSTENFDMDGLGLLGESRSLLTMYRRRIPFA